VRPRLHGPSVVGRARADRNLLVLTGLVVVLATLLTASVAPLTERTSDHAIAAAARDAGQRGTVVATTRDQGDDGRRIRDPRSADLVRVSSESAQREMPARLAAVVRAGVTSLSTPPLHLLDAGPGRYLRLAYVTGPDGRSPAVTYIAGGPPGPSVPAAEAGREITVDVDPWPVQVALPQQTAAALDLVPGDTVPAEDEQRRDVRLTVSGIFTVDDPDDDVWTAVPSLLRPVVGTSDVTPSASGAAIASADSLPDLRLAVPTDDLTSRIVFRPRPAELRWDRSDDLVRAIVALKASGGSRMGGRSWDSLLDGVLEDGRSQVTAARGQAAVLVIGLVTGAVLVLVLSAGLLVRRRSGSIALLRERGAQLPSIFIELLLEAVVVAVLGSAIGMLLARALVGDVGWWWTWPVVVVAASAGPVLGAVAAARAADTRRAPANRSARRVAARARHVRRLLAEGMVLAVAVVSYVALRQRGVVDGDATATSAPTWWALAGGLVLVRLLPPVARLALTRARRATGVVPLVAAARTAQAVGRALPLLAVVVMVAQITIGLALVATEQHGQAQGALMSVGGDARLRTSPDGSATGLAAEASRSPDVRAAAAARVVDGVQVSSGSAATAVRLVVVDSAAYRRLLAATPLPDAPALSRLEGSAAGGVVPALLRGGDRDLRDGLRLRWQDTLIRLEVVGEAPRIGEGSDPVLVVDAASFAATGAAAEPDTVWAVGPGAAAALRTASGSSGTVTALDDVLDRRRTAPLASGLVDLATVSAILLGLFAALAVIIAAAAEALPR
jgi:putative ABC transport system permease protein